MHRWFAGFMLASVAVALSSGQPALGDTGGGAPAGQFVMRMPGIASDSASGITFDPGISASGVRYCRYVPGLSPPAQLGPSPAVAPPPAYPAAPPNSSVPFETTAAQLETFDELVAAVQTKYADPQFNGNDWAALTAEFEAKILAGLTQDNFHALMKLLIIELDDGHSRYQTAEEVAAEAAETTEGESYVGIGALIQRLSGGQGSIIAVYPGSGAQDAGLRPHDLVLDVDGGPVYFDDGSPPPTRGPEGTTVNVRVQRGGGTPFVLSIVRKALVSVAPIDSCLIAGSRIGYIFIPTFFDTSVAGQVREALENLMAGGPLEGLVIDNRLNSGGFESQAKAVLGFFTSGDQGSYLRRDGETPFTITAEPIGNSQTVPLAVLVGEGTASFGEVTSGVLQRSGRATVIGTTTEGNVEILQATTFGDGSRIYIATITFQANGLPAGAWEDTGIVPDVTVNGLWHEYTELNDPALARAAAVLRP